jgi:riboflavin biosynthesis pyrimidine reductase
VEAGPTLVKSFVTDAVKMVDKMSIYIAPVVLKENPPLPVLPKMLIDSEEKLENTLAVEGHFDI